MDLAALEEEARSLLPGPTYDYLAGGAGDELTLGDNVTAWDRVRLRPRVLRDVGTVDMTTTALGTPVASPVLVAPTAFHKLAHPDGEAATAAGAAAAGALFVAATRSTTPLEDIAAASGPGAPRWYQVYVLQERDHTAELVQRAAKAGYTALVLTGDTPLLGQRLRDVRNAFVLPANVGEAAMQSGAAVGSLVDQDPTITFEAIDWLRELSGLPVLVKGVLRGDDAEACLAAGAAGVCVSNHGGRQLDGAIAAADALVEVVDAVGGRGEVYVDGGVRRGVDVVRALALGARGVMVGRPVLWGLATGGSEGVRRVLLGFQHELAVAMALCGARTVDEVTGDLVARP
ncbi:MAG: 4-hydroxymandelate oxidase [Actinomycetota bacterium]|jgi:4-hydroxymandelate oxidase